MNDWEGANRRKFLRVKYPCVVVIRSDKKKKGNDKNNTFVTRTENIGMGGVCVILDRKIKIFSNIELELDLLDMHEHVNFTGQVVWSIQKKDENTEKPLVFYTGVKFSGIKGEGQTRLEKAIEGLIKNGRQ